VQISADERLGEGLFMRVGAALAAKMVLAPPAAAAATLAPPPATLDSL
jgi:hypothetical protein